MVVRVLALGAALTVQACGRSSQGPAELAGDSGGDGGPQAPVCSAPCVVADTHAGFSGTQGQNGLYYGHWVASQDADGVYAPAELIPLDFRAGHNNTYSLDDLWKPVGTATECCDPSFTWTMIHQDGMHPDADPVIDVPIRRWVSTVSGAAHVHIALRKADPSGGDGVTGELHIDGALAWTGSILGTDDVGLRATVPVDLVPGTLIDALLWPGPTDGNDLTSFGFRVTD